MSELHDLSATELSELLRSRRLSPVELMEHYLARAERLADRLGVFITATPDLALDAARKAERTLLTSEPRSLGHLFGLPTAIKDLEGTAGVRTTLGCAVLGSYVPEADDHAVALLRSGGLISIGKTNVPEFGVACYTANDLAPDARCPWDETRSAAGSSGGSAAAVAAGVVPIAHGSDGGGSIRTPAASCGLIGFKSSRGAVSTFPQLSWIGNASDGPLARTVEDAAAFLDVLAGPCPADPFNNPLPRGAYSASVGRDPGRLRIARTSRSGHGGSVHPDCIATWELTSKLLADLGHEVVDIDPPDAAVFDEMIDGFVSVFAVAVTSLVDLLIPAHDEGMLQPLSAWFVERGRRSSAMDLQHGLGALMTAATGVLAAIEPYDILLTPTTSDLAAPVDWLKADGNPDESWRRIVAWSPFTPAYNVSGNPAVSLPIGTSTTGLPVGVQLVGRRWQDDRLISIAAQLEQAAPWRDRHPAVWHDA